MGHVIAMAGKGGVGKTTLCGLLIQHLCESGKKPVLAVDADANSNLNEVLGVEIGPTLGELREEIERAGADPKYQIPHGITKADWLEIRMSDALTETKDFDLLVMGRSQGQGCYCFVNGLVQTQVQKLQSQYPYIVVDKPVWNTSAAVFCPTWRRYSWSATAPVGAFKLQAALPSSWQR